MRAVLRRAAGPSRRDRLAVGEIEIDRLSRTVRVAGGSVALSAKEYELLVALAAEPERVFHKDELLRDVWGFRSLGKTRTLDSHASRLRRKLNSLADSAYVINVWGLFELVAGDVGIGCKRAPRTG
jgi:DNA-binding response OmpR family regulator